MVFLTLKEALDRTIITVATLKGSAEVFMQAIVFC